MPAFGCLMLGLAACAATDRSGPRPPQSPMETAASARSDDATVTILVGPKQRTDVIRFEPGLTLVPLLMLDLALSPGRYPKLVELERRGGVYRIDVDAIARGDRKDEPIELGDKIVVAEDFPLRPQRHASVATPAASPNPVASGAPATCGELLLREAGLVGTGRVERHPEVIAVREAILARCASRDDVADSLRHASTRWWSKSPTSVAVTALPIHVSSAEGRACHLPSVRSRAATEPGGVRVASREA